MRSFARGDGNTHNKSLHYYDMLTNENLLSTNQIKEKKNIYTLRKREHFGISKIRYFLSHGKSKIYF